MARSGSVSSGTSATADTILIMKIDIGDGRTGKIDVKAGEEYSVLAKRFCLEHDLPADEVAPMLAEHIEKSVQETLASGRSSQGSASSAPSHAETDAAERHGRGKDLISDDQVSSRTTKRDSDTDSQTRLLSRPDSTSSAPTELETRDSRIQANYNRFSKDEKAINRSGILRNQSVDDSVDSRSSRKTGPTHEWSPMDARWEGSQGASGARLQQSALESLSDSARLPYNWDHPLTSRPSTSRSSQHRGGTPVWKKLYSEGMKHKARKQERIDEEKRKWIAGPNRAAGPESAEFSHLYTPRPKSAPRERPGRAQPDWQEESSIRESSRSSSRKKSRGGDEGGPVWERLYQECRIKNEQRKMLAQMEKDEEAVTGLFGSMSKTPRRDTYDPEVFERLYETGLQKRKEKLRRHNEAEQAKVDQYFRRRKSMHDGKAVEPFQPDIYPMTRTLGRDKSLEDDLDALGVRKQLCLEEREVLRDCMQLDECTFRPQINHNSSKMASEARQRRAPVHEHLYEQMQTLADSRRKLRNECASARSTPSKRLTKEAKQVADNVARERERLDSRSEFELLQDRSDRVWRWQAVVDRLWSRHEQELRKMEEERQRMEQSPSPAQSPHLRRNPHGESHGYGPGLESGSSTPAFRPGGTPDEEAGRMRRRSSRWTVKSRANPEAPVPGSGTARSRTAEELYNSRHLDALERIQQREAQEQRFAELAAMAKTCRGSNRIMEKKQGEHLRALFMVLDRNNQGVIQAPTHAVQVQHMKNFFADPVIADLVVDALADHATVSTAAVSYDLFREVCMHKFRQVLPSGFSGWHLIFGHAKRAPSMHGGPGGRARVDSEAGYEEEQDGGELGELPFFNDDVGEISPVCGPRPDRELTLGSQRRAPPAGQFYRDEMERIRMKEAWLQQKRRHRELRELAECTFMPAVCTPQLSAEPETEAQ